MEPLVCIVFDDGNNSDYTVAFMEMRKRGMVGTSYLITSPAIRTLSASVVRIMKNSGWEFGCHTHNHVSLNTLSSEQIIESMLKVNEWYAMNGFPAPEHHAYPMGEFNNNIVVPTINQYRTTQRRTGTNGINTYETINFKGLLACNADMTTDARLVELKGLVNQTITQKGILILYSHGVTKNSRFIQLLDYIVTSSIRVVTIGAMVAIVDAWRTT